MFNKALFCTGSSEKARRVFPCALSLAKADQGGLLILHADHGPFRHITNGLTPHRSSEARSSVEAPEEEERGQEKEKKVKYTCPCGFSSYDLTEFLKHPFLEYALEDDEKDSKKFQEEEK